MSSAELKFHLIIMGFLRQTEDGYSIIVPDGIKQLILNYYPKKINYVGKFLRENAGIMIQIQPNQISFNGYRAAKLDQPLPISLEYKNISMIYRWRAVNEAPYCGHGVIFGVVSNRCKDFHDYPFLTLKDAFGISMKDGLIFDGSGLYEDENNAPQYRAFKQFATLKQQDEESLTEWNRRFKQERDIFKQMMGKEFLNEFVSESEWFREETDSDKKNLIKDRILIGLGYEAIRYT